MKRAITLFAIATTLILMSCGNELADDLVGTWTGISWNVEGREKPNANKVKFQFNADDTYTATYGSENESGTYRVFGRNLYTTAEGKLEKLVKFDFDEDLNLIFAMNRVGTAERIVLRKEAKVKAKGN